MEPSQRYVEDLMNWFLIVTVFLLFTILLLLRELRRERARSQRLDSIIQHTVESLKRANRLLSAMSAHFSKQPSDLRPEDFE